MSGAAAGASIAAGPALAAVRQAHGTARGAKPAPPKTVYASSVTSSRSVRKRAAFTIIGSFGSKLLGSAGDLTFAGGRLYALVFKSGSTETYLATVNPRTGAAKIIGNTGFKNVWGLVTGTGALYGATQGGLFVVISPATGRAKAIWKDGLAIGGLATP